MTPVDFGYASMAWPMILNCSMMDAPFGTAGIGKSREQLLATQTFSCESSARPRTLMPQRKVSTFDGSSAGNRTSVSDWELLTQTRFWESMTMSNGDFKPVNLDDFSGLDFSTGEIEQLIVGAVGNPDIPVRGDANAHQAEEFFLEREIGFPWRRACR